MADRHMPTGMTYLNPLSGLAPLSKFNLRVDIDDELGCVCIDLHDLPGGASILMDGDRARQLSAQLGLAVARLPSSSEPVRLYNTPVVETVLSVDDCKPFPEGATLGMMPQEASIGELRTERVNEIMAEQLGLLADVLGAEGHAWAGKVRQLVQLVAPATEMVAAAV